MRFDDYVTACNRTAAMNKGEKVETAVKALGLVGELVELGAVPPHDLEGVLKEAGDVIWYASTFAARLGLDGAALGVVALDDFTEHPYEFDGMTPPEVLSTAFEAAGKLAELVKKYLDRDKPIDTIAARVELRKVFVAVRHFVPFYLSHVAEANVAKLKARYPNGWDAALALNKDAPAVDIRPKNIDGDGRQVEEAEALAEPETVGHYPAGGVVGEWKPGPV